MNERKTYFFIIVLCDCGSVKARFSSNAKRQTRSGTAGPQVLQTKTHATEACEALEGCV